MRKVISFILVLAMSLTSCGDAEINTQDNHLAANDFESVDGWTENVTSLSITKERAHSGQYSVKVAPNLQYSMGYHNVLSRLSSSKVKKIRVRGWVNLSNGATETLLVTELGDASNPNAKPILWEGLKLSDKIKSYDKWVEVEKVVVLSEDISYSNKFNVYLWNTGAKETVYLDDLIIDKVE